MASKYKKWKIVAPLCCGAVSVAVLSLYSSCRTTTDTVEINEEQSTSEISASTEKLSFNRDIRPILSENCFACHGFDAHERKADLRLDTAEGAYAALKDFPDRKVIVPGEPDKSSVVQRMFTNDPDDVMPPPEFHREMTEEEKQTIKVWIEQGAEYENHWAYQKIKDPKLPNIKGTQVRNSIDHFILAALEKEGSKLSEEANNRTLLRRVSLDLTGLPPTPEEMRVFLQDTSADAYEKQVERLMASPHYGERMAVPWLDVARFADTVAYHGDQNQHIFPYRDYVINAFNSNMPFDRFTREQLGGDLMENPTEEQLIATGFIRLSLMTREGGAQKDEYLAKYMGDRVRALGAAWMGQTIGCAECHDHKYDPIKAKDYYALGAFFSDMKQWGVYHDYNYTPEPDLKGFSNDHPFPPELLYESPSSLSQLNRLQWKYTMLASKVGEQSPHVYASLMKFIGVNPTGWETGKILSAKGAGAKVEAPYQVKFVGPLKKTETVVVDFGGMQERVAAIQLKVPVTEEHGGFVGRGKDGSFTLRKPTFEVIRKDGSKQNIKLSWVQADRYRPERYRDGHDIHEVNKEWRSGPERWIFPKLSTKYDHHLVCHLEKAIKLEEGDKIRFTSSSMDIGALQIQTTPIIEPVAGRDVIFDFIQNVIATPEKERRESHKAHLRGMAVRYAAPFTKLPEQAKKLTDSIRKARSGYARSLISLPLAEDEIPEVRILPRGNWQDKSGEVVMPATPEFLPKLKGAEGKKRLNRLDLANWLLADDNPLVSRHIVNRTWRQFFGQGLSGVLDDLGSQGEMPSHPDLLDHLAISFKKDWDYKKLIRMIVTSHAYRQKAAQKTELLVSDPYNRMLSTQSARRLDAEFIRDNALAISGLLNKDIIGGASVFPYQPEGYYIPLNFPKRKYYNSLDDGQYRRGLYMHWQRTFVHPMLANFDAPSREECAADRLQSNSPLQALNLLNDPTFVEAANHFANRVYLSNNEDEKRLDYAFELALGRLPSIKEKSSLMKLLEAQKKRYQADRGDAVKLLSTGNSKLHYVPYSKDLAAWTQVCRVILNLHETITRY